jgi:hypothetical protein
MERLDLVAPVFSCRDAKQVTLEETTFEHIASAFGVNSSWRMSERVEATENVELVSPRTYLPDILLRS